MNKLTSVLGAFAVIAIAVVFILQFRPASNTGPRDNAPTCAIEVRGSCVADSTQFWAAYRLIAANADPTRLRAMGLRRKIADGLLEQWLLNQDAKRLGITVSEDELSAELGNGRAHVSIPATDIRAFNYYLQLGDESVRYFAVKSPKTKKYDQKVYDKEVRLRTRLSTVDFRAMQRDEVVAARMRDLVRSRVRISEAEAHEAYVREKATATVDYIRFDRRFYADLVVDQSPKVVEAWTTAHKDEIDKVWESRKAQILPECRSLREIMIRLDGTTASDDEKAKAKAKIERVKERLAKGEEFADVARAMSDSVTAHRGGEVGCLLRGKAPKPLEEAAMALTAGKVSDVVTTETGLYLIKIDQIAKDADAEKLGRSQMAKELYVSQEAERLTLEAARNVIAAAKGKTFKEALDLHLAELAKAKGDGDEKKDEKKADEKKDEKKADDKKADEDHPPLAFANHPGRPTVETTLPFNAAGDPITGVRGSGEVAKLAFGMERVGDVSDVLAHEVGYVAIQLKEKTPASEESWAKDKELRILQMRTDKANSALIAYVKRLHGQLAVEVKYTKSLIEESKNADGPAGPSDEE